VSAAMSPALRASLLAALLAAAAGSGGAAALRGAAEPAPPRVACEHPAGDAREDISNNTGTCPREYQSTDPRVFGPLFWPTFHTMSVNYPERPNLETALACTSFIKSLPWLIPCGHCGHDFHDFIRLNVRRSGCGRPGREACPAACSGSVADGENLCLSPWEACRAGRDAVVSFFARAHNNVNAHTHPCRRPWTVAHVSAVYARRAGSCLHNIVWGTCVIPRDEPQLKAARPDLATGLSGPMRPHRLCNQAGGPDHQAPCCDESSSKIPANFTTAPDEPLWPEVEGSD